jgi:hypothetical protein
MKEGKLADKMWKFMGLIKNGKDKLSGKLKLGKFVVMIHKVQGRLSSEPRKLVALIFLEACVFGLAYWIVGRFFPAAEVIYDAILIIFIFAVGVTIMLRGNATRNRTLNTLGFLVFLVAVFVVIYRYEEFAVKISAFAALLVAFAAFASIEESRRVRQDSVERESRDRRERLVDEVAKWLRGLEGNISAASDTLMTKISRIEDRLKGSPAIDFEHWLKVDEMDLAVVELDNIMEAMNEVEYYQKLTLQLDGELSKLIGVIRKKIKERGNLRSEHITYIRGHMKKAVEGKSVDESPQDDNRTLKRSSSSEEDIINKKLEKNALALWKSIQKAIEKVIEIKTSFIKVD